MPHDRCVVDLQNKPNNFTEIYAKALAGDDSVRAKVPVLEVDGMVMVESMVILEYLQDKFPGAETTPERRAACRLFADRFSSCISYMPVLKATAGSSEESEALEKLVAGLKSVDAFLREFGDDEGPFLLGSTFSLAEEACAPFAQRFFTVLPGIRPEHNPIALLEEHGLTRLLDWFEAVCTRPSCVETIPPADELVGGYRSMLERMAAATA